MEINKKWKELKIVDKNVNSRAHHSSVIYENQYFFKNTIINNIINFILKSLNFFIFLNYDFRLYVYGGYEYNNGI